MAPWIRRGEGDWVSFLLKASGIPIGIELHPVAVSGQGHTEGGLPLPSSFHGKPGLMRSHSTSASSRCVGGLMEYTVIRNDRHKRSDPKKEGSLSQLGSAVMERAWA